MKKPAIGLIWTIGWCLMAGIELGADAAVTVSSAGRIIAGQSARRLQDSIDTGCAVYHYKLHRNRIGCEVMDITAEQADGTVGIFRDIPGNGCLVSCSGYVAAFDAPESGSIPTTVRIMDARGFPVFSERFHGLFNPQFSPDGSSLIFQTPASTLRIDLPDFTVLCLPVYDLLAAGPRNWVAGYSADRGNIIEILTPEGSTGTIEISGFPLKMAFSYEGDTLWIVQPDTVRCFDVISMELLHELCSRPDERFQDLTAFPGGMLVGARRIEGDRSMGLMIVIGPEGDVAGRVSGEMGDIEQKVSVPRLPDDLIPWPYAPVDQQHPIGNTYGSFQGFDPYHPYLHPGIDIMGSPGQAVYAVRSGVVKAILTTSAEYHWRVAVSDSGTSDPCEGYLYAHLIENSIAVNIGDAVTAGQLLGHIIEWPIAGFHHCHFARIQDSGSTWHGSWLCTQNPNFLMAFQTETEVPRFDEAVSGQVFAFCRNETSQYLNPSSLSGDVDIIARISDRIEYGEDCAVTEISYSIYPQGHPEMPVVDNKQSVLFDMPLDNYQGGSHDSQILPIFYKQDSTCRTVFDYDLRRLYHIVTNSNGDQTYDQADLDECWNTAAVTDGFYVIEVTARDAAGNQTSAAMTVYCSNGTQATPTPPPAPTPTISATPSPTPVQTVPGFGVRLDMPAYVHPGDEFHITGLLDNPGETRQEVPVVFILQGWDGYWFWPGWSHYRPPEYTEIDYARLDIPFGSTPVEVVPSQIFPEFAEGADGLCFYGAMLNNDMTATEGTVAFMEFGFGN